jgi:hypothetical protein
MLKSINNEKYVKWIGFFAGLLYLSRPLNIVFVLTLSVYILIKHRKHFFMYILYALPPAFFLFAYNTYAWGQPFTSEYVVKGNTQFSTPILEGVLGNLFSPARSFIFISPPLVVGFYGMFLALKKKKKDKFDILMFVLSITFILIFIVYSKWWCWYGADRFGYGFFTEWVPLVSIFTFIVLKPKGRFVKVLFALLLIWSVFVQFNAVLYRKSRCGPDHNWDFYCLKPLMFSKQEY